MISPSPSPPPYPLCLECHLHRNQLRSLSRARASSRNQAPIHFNEHAERLTQLLTLLGPCSTRMLTRTSARCLPISPSSPSASRVSRRRAERHYPKSRQIFPTLLALVGKPANFGVRCRRGGRIHRVISRGGLGSDPPSLPPQDRSSVTS